MSDIEINSKLVEDLLDVIEPNIDSYEWTLNIYGPDDTNDNGYEVRYRTELKTNTNYKTYFALLVRDYKRTFSIFGKTKIHKKYNITIKEIRHDDNSFKENVLINVNESHMIPEIFTRLNNFETNIQKAIRNRECLKKKLVELKYEDNLIKLTNELKNKNDNHD